MTNDTSNLPTYDETLQRASDAKQHKDGAEGVYLRGDDGIVAKNRTPDVQPSDDGNPKDKVETRWYKKGNKSTRDGELETKKHSVLREAKAVAHCIVSIPCMVVGAGLSVTGHVVRGVGSVVAGVGDAMMKDSRRR